ncbi:hypothetical protein [Olsenella sp. An293]|uniref:hypothetical protein n=1 Tax=Olsenella sp. An293 TaxID=1965626 RepID=UPI000B37E678|nr:hypothetical protein [Olsenella sp. An293]OUO33601.1 hypothetical protein B5F85_01720 [Olsenella sp. An293]
MSLRDTIDGARREAEGNAVGRPKKEAENIGAGEEEKKGFSRSSAAKARPSREAASSVRMASKPKSSAVPGTESKEEKRERKRREREEQDFRNRAYDLLLRSNPDYKRTERVFWIILGIGLALAVISLVCVYLFGQDPDMGSWEGILSVGSLVAAYGFMIASFFYDWAKRRPYRKETEGRVRGLSDKKLLELLEKARAEEDAKKK